MARNFLVMLGLLAGCYGFNFVLVEFIEVVYVDYINLCGLAIILAVGLNVINGLAGQFSLGHAGFMSVGAFAGAYASIMLTYGVIESGPLSFASMGSFLLCLALSGLSAAAVGALVGAPTLRLKGDYLAIATLGFAEITRIVLTAQDAIGGPTGLKRIPKMPLLPGAEKWDGGTSTFWIYAFVCLVILLSLNLQRSTFGRALICVRENELAAETMGVRAARMKVMAFVYGAFFAGIAGCLYAHYQHSVRPDDFTTVRSIEVVVMLVLGGLGSLTGAVVGAVIVTLMPQFLRPLEEFLNLSGLSMVVYAGLLLLMMLFRPQGIFGQRELSLKLLRRLVPGAGRESGP